MITGQVSLGIITKISIHMKISLEKRNKRKNNNEQGELINN